MDFDALMVGAGFAGSVTARRLAEAGRKVLVIESRAHIGGNAYDCEDEAGIFIHRYGPHIFHTGDKRVFDFLSRFTAWREYQHRVAANVHGALMPVPFNLTSLEQAFGERAPALREKLLAAYGEGKKVTILELRENADPALAEVAQYVYENVFLRYTVKQWGMPPEAIDPATTARVPVFLSMDDRYFQDPYQGMPLHGYTPMFEAMLDHPNITVQLNTRAEEVLTLGEDGTISFRGEPFGGLVVYTGAADALFGNRFGQLPYRTLDFAFETHPVERYQTHGTVNYTVNEDFTRITEFKYLTGQVADGRTTIMKEYARAYTGGAGEIPYYAVLSPESNALYAQYADLAALYPNLRLLGRLAEYKYYNMDAIVARALALCDELLEGTT